MRTTYYPGPFDRLAGLPDEIWDVYQVWVGWEEADSADEETYDSPPLQLPAGACGWRCHAWDGPRHWYARFDDAAAAEAFALSLPARAENERIPPLKRT